MSDPDKVCSRCGASYPADVIFCPKDGTPLGARKTEIVDDPYLGLVVAGQFRIDQLIGIGAMGRVYRAHQSGIDRDVAIKILHRDLLRNPTVIARFHREAKVASRLVHPNVVQMLMTGELERVSRDVGGEAYLVMEYLDGISLRSALAAAGGALPLPRALHVILQVCDAVGEAHVQGIVHRDLKPENVMLVKRGDDTEFAKVLDFGVARIDWSDGSMATQAGAIFGTARYISPEGAQGAKVSAPSDVYSIAIMLFQCLSGETPFDGDSPVAILLKHTSEQAPDLRSRTRASYVPEALARMISANLAKDPAERCRNAREFGRALLEAARSAGLSPDDLVVRSTLVANVHGALQLASIERTKSMGLTPELAAKMADGSRSGATSLLEPEHAKTESAGSTRSQTTPGEDSVRRSSVEPTMHDEPLERISSPQASRRPLSSQPSQPTGPHSLPARISWPEHTPPQDGGSPALRRWVVVAACFTLGVALTAVAAHRLGAFAERDPGADSYAERARGALAAGAFDAPPGENVKDITDTALRRWPRSESVLAVRRDTARTLTDASRGLKTTDRAKAVRFAALASELDPESREARSLVDELRALPVAVEKQTTLVTDKPQERAPTERPPRPRSPKTPPAPSAAGAAPKAPAPADSAPSPAPAPTPGGGRWL
jgi:eukaryotic-like serine/threonine-protein kinase